MKNINKKIKKVGFTKKELFKFRRKYKEIKHMYSKNIAKEICLKSIILDDAKDAFNNITIYIYMFIFFVIGSLMTSTIKDAIIYSLMIVPVIFLSVISSAKNKSITIQTELKLIMLHLILLARA